MAGLNIVGFASGSPLSQLAMAAIAAEHRLSAIVVPPALRPGGWRAWLGSQPSAFAKLDAPLIGEDEITRHTPDLIVVASFPARISAAALAAAPLGGLNLHMSLLPRHRGIDPIFWTYFDDDREAGITIHWMDTAIDEGDIAAQQAIALARGRASRDLYFELAEKGVVLLRNVLDAVQQGSAERRPQPAQGASYESGKQIAAARVPFARWTAERVWHVLSGLGGQRHGLVEDAAGRRIDHGRATGFEHVTVESPGHIDENADGYRLHCADGLVSLARLR